MIGYWRTQARAVIAEVHKTLPEDADLKTRKQAVDAAYPFGPRSHHPYKMWLKERRNYLGRYGYTGPGKPDQLPLLKPQMPESPLERAKRRSLQIQQNRGSK